MTAWKDNTPTWFLLPDSASSNIVFKELTAQVTEESSKSAKPDPVSHLIYCSYVLKHIRAHPHFSTPIH